MTLQEALQNKTAATECFACLEEARRKLTGVPLTAELFNEINGADRGLEHLLGRDVILPTDTEGIIALRNEIFASIESEQIRCGEVARAALECLGEDLVETVSKYDAYATQNTEVRAKIKTVASGLSKDAAAAFCSSKCDFSCFSNADILEIAESFKDMTKFLKSDVVNTSKIQDLMSKQGQEMTDEDKDFLKDLKKIFGATVRSEDKTDKLWQMEGNKLTGATVEALGFDKKSIVSTSEAFGKAEEGFIAAVRVLREVLEDRPIATDSVVIKNQEFDDALWGMCYWCRRLGDVRIAVNEQFSLMLKILETTSAPSAPAEPEKKDDDDQQDDNQQPEEPENPTEDNQGGEA